MSLSPPRTLLLLWGACVFLLSLAGCAARKDYGYAQGAASPMEMEESVAYAPRAESMRSMGKMAERDDMGDYAPAPAPPPPPPSDSAPAPEPAPAPVAASRMVHYEGWARLRVSQLDETVDRITEMTEALGGKIEALTRTRVVVRVPVASFRQAFPTFLELGDVLARSISAQDVTDAFTAMELRMRTAQAARDRLIALLARSTDEAEKLQLLREIQRLEEEIDRLGSQSATLSELASMSRITLELVPRDAVVANTPVPESAALAWIRGLTPFSSGVWASGRRLFLEVPAGMVSLDPKRYTAEAADGARVRGSRIPNEPEGDGAFWIEAIRSRLAPEFAAVSVRTVGAFHVLRMEERGEDPYVYVIAVRPRGAWMDFVEVYLPTRAAEERHAPALDAVLAGGDA